MQTFAPLPDDRLAEADIAGCVYQSVLAEIIGVVSPQSQGGWQRDGYGIHSFSFAAWRRVDHDALLPELTVLRPVPPKSNYFSDYVAGDILRVRVLLSLDETRAIVAQVTNAHAVDAALARVADEQAKPVEIQTERFGTLVLDRSINWFRGTATWNGQAVEITFDADANRDISEHLQTAETLFRAETAWQRRIEAFAVKEKLSLAHDWQEEGEPISEQEFLDRMELESISIQPDGKFEFWHSDGDLFAGHAIQISGSLAEGLTQSDIPG